MDDAQEAVRSIRILNGVFLMTVFLYAVIGEQLAGSGWEGAYLKMLRLFLSPVALVLSVIALFFGWQKARGAEEELLRDPQNMDALVRWKSGHIAAFISCETVALLGLVVRFSGGALRDAAPFYIGGLILLLLFFPRAEFALKT